MAAKPVTTPRWARTLAGADAANILTPTSGESDTGYTNGQAVISSSKTNWIHNLVFRWLLYLQDAVFTATAASGLAGIDATGDGAAPGVKATPGGGGTPARGALALGAQVAPSAPANGDVWATAAALFARISGATLQVADTTQTAFGILLFGGTPGNVAGTYYLVAGAGANGVACPTAAVVNQSSAIFLPRQIVVRGFSITTSTMTAGGTITISVNGNVNAQFVLTAASGSQTYNTAALATPVTLFGGSGNSIYISVVNGVGVTTGIGAAQAAILYSLT